MNPCAVSPLKTFGTFVKFLAGGILMVMRGPESMVAVEATDALDTLEDSSDG